MKRKSKTKWISKPSAPDVLNDALPEHRAEDPAMVRTQIYLSRSEHSFVQQEANRRGEPMAAVIRSFIDEKMTVPEDVWTDNPLLRPPVPDSTWTGHPDGAVNHDHYVYGTPKKWTRRKGKAVETPPVPEDYYSNPKSRRAYDEEADRQT